MTAISRGNTVITAKSADGKYVATCNVLVEDITDKVECTVGNGGFVANFNGVIQMVVLLEFHSEIVVKILCI